MSKDKYSNQYTQHALLVVWGVFAEHIGLPQAFRDLSLKQKAYKHRPQAKVMEFLVAILAGLPHLQDISRAAHPLEKDQALDVHQLGIKRQVHVGAYVSRSHQPKFFRR